MAKRYAVCILCDHAHSFREPHVLLGGPEPSKAVRDLAAVVVAIGPMTEREAVDLTNRIRRTRDDWLRLVYEAYEREAWRAMRYGSWADYVAGELPMGKSRAYQLIAHAKITLALGIGGDYETRSDAVTQSATPESGEKVHKSDAITEGQTRNISKAARERVAKAATVDSETGRNQLAREVKRVLPPKVTKQTRDPATGAACEHPRTVSVTICADCGKRIE